MGAALCGNRKRLEEQYYAEAVGAGRPHDGDDGVPRRVSDMPKHHRRRTATQAMNSSSVPGEQRSRKYYRHAEESLSNTITALPTHPLMPTSAANISATAANEEVEITSDHKAAVKPSKEASNQEEHFPGNTEPRSSKSGCRRSRGTALQEINPNSVTPQQPAQSSEYPCVSPPPSSRGVHGSGAGRQGSVLMGSVHGHLNGIVPCMAAEPSQGRDIGRGLRTSNHRCVASPCSDSQAICSAVRIGEGDAGRERGMGSSRGPKFESGRAGKMLGSASGGDSGYENVNVQSGANDGHVPMYGSRKDSTGQRGEDRGGGDGGWRDGGDDLRRSYSLTGWAGRSSEDDGNAANAVHDSITTAELWAASHVHSQAQAQLQAEVVPVPCTNVEGVAGSVPSGKFSAAAVTAVQGMSVEGRGCSGRGSASASQAAAAAAAVTAACSSVGAGGKSMGVQQTAGMISTAPRASSARKAGERGEDGAVGADGVVQVQAQVKASVRPPVRWQRGELIGAGASGSVYIGMDLDSGELIAVKQVAVPTNSMSKGKAQEYIRALESEVAVLSTLNHPNIVRYLGTSSDPPSSPSLSPSPSPSSPSPATLNVFLEFVPGGSISSLLCKFGSFSEKVISTYTRQIVEGLAYLHANQIMHRDIKGANILVDVQGGIKLADFGASKKLADLASMSIAAAPPHTHTHTHTGAPNATAVGARGGGGGGGGGLMVGASNHLQHKSMHGTAYWMAPEVITQTGHGRPADLWSVGCTVIEMATGRPPWSEFESQVSAMFHIAQSASPPALPSHLSSHAKDFILLCMRRDPRARPTAQELLQHPFLSLPDAMEPGLPLASFPPPLTPPPLSPSSSLSPSPSSALPLKYGGRSIESSKRESLNLQSVSAASLFSLSTSSPPSPSFSHSTVTPPRPLYSSSLTPLTEIFGSHSHSRTPPNATNPTTTILSRAPTQAAAAAEAMCGCARASTDSSFSLSMGLSLQTHELHGSQQAGREGEEEEEEDDVVQSSIHSQQYSQPRSLGASMFKGSCNSHGPSHSHSQGQGQGQGPNPSHSYSQSYSMGHSHWRSSDASLSELSMQSDINPVEEPSVFLPTHDVSDTELDDGPHFTGREKGREEEDNNKSCRLSSRHSGRRRVRGGERSALEDTAASPSPLLRSQQQQQQPNRCDPRRVEGGSRSSDMRMVEGGGCDSQPTASAHSQPSAGPGRGTAGTGASMRMKGGGRGEDGRQVHEPGEKRGVGEGMGSQLAGGNGSSRYRSNGRKNIGEERGERRREEMEIGSEEEGQEEEYGGTQEERDSMERQIHGFLQAKARELQRLHASLLESTVLQLTATAPRVRPRKHSHPHDVSRLTWHERELSSASPRDSAADRHLQHTASGSGSGSGSGNGNDGERGGSERRSVQQQKQQQQQQWEEELRCELEEKKRGVWLKPDRRTHYVE